MLIMYISIFVLIFGSLLLFETFYCTSSGRQRVYEVFNPIMFFALLVMFIVNSYLLYAFYKIAQIMPTNHSLNEAYHLGIYIILGMLWNLFVLFAPGSKYSGLFVIGALGYGASFMLFAVSFLLYGGLGIIAAGVSNINGSVNLDEAFAEILHEHMHDHTDGIIYGFFEFGLKIFVVVIIISIIEFVKQLDENSDGIKISLLVMFSVLTGIYFIAGFLSYLVGDIIWET
jgi:hypothetical protein